jgi:exonuclease SbcC
MEGLYTIDSIEIEGFRGYLDKLTHNLRHSSTVIFGPQGSGKSSTLNAIEWCLFGKVAYFKSTESKSDSEIVNARAGGREAKVRIELGNGKAKIEITRTKKINNKETNLLVNIEQRTEEGTQAQETIFKVLGLTFDDFYRSVYLHQESINALITDDPRKRDEAIDRLLGLERVRNIIGSIPMQAINKSLAELTAKKETMSAKLQGAIEQIADEVGKAENEAKKGGVATEQITTVEISKRLAMLQNNINEIAREGQLEPISIPTDLTADEVTKLIHKMRAFLRNSKKRVVEVTGVDELRKKRDGIIELKLEYDKLFKNKAEKEREIKAIESEFGNIESIEFKISETNKRIEELTKDIDELDARAKLAKDALYFFEGSLISDCPVCGQNISYEVTKRHLEEMIDNAKGKRVDEIYTEIGKAKDRYKELSNKRGELIDLKKELSILLNQIASLESKCSELAGRKTEFGEIGSFLDGSLISLQNRITESNNAFKTKNDHIEVAEDEVEGIQVINNVLLKREQYEAAETRSKEENEESKGLSQSIVEIEKFKDNLDVLVHSLNEIQNSSAAQSISQAKEKMSSLYARLMAHPYYDQLDITATSKNVQGVQKNTYLIKAKSSEESRDTYVISRFSAGQLNCTALSIFLSLAEISQSKIGFIMLDDPSQSLDDEHVKGLSEVLSEFSKSIQVIISTQEDNLYRNLKSTFSKNGTYNDIKFQPWTKSGCRLVSGQE